MKRAFLSALIAVVFSATAHAEAPEAKTDVAVSWQKGIAYVPGKIFTTSPAEISTEQRHPVVLYLHGCSGIGPTDQRWGSFLKDLGYIVIQPDSLKRDRPRSCDPVAKKARLFNGVHSMRREEVNFAREQIAKSAWADHENVFLMGHSEGGVAVSQTMRGDFRGAVISGWHCGWGLTTVRSIPVLAIDHESDPWYPGVPGGGCANYFGDRLDSKMITLPMTMTASNHLLRKPWWRF